VHRDVLCLLCECIVDNDLSELMTDIARHLKSRPVSISSPLYYRCLSFSASIFQTFATEFFWLRLPACWKLPQSVTSAPSLTLFRKRLTSRLFSRFSPNHGLSSNSTWLVSTQHDSTRSTCWAHDILAVSSLSNSMARLTRHVELDWLDVLNMSSSAGSTRNLICCVVCINL